MVGIPKEVEQHTNDIPGMNKLMFNSSKQSTLGEQMKIRQLEAMKEAADQEVQILVLFKKFFLSVTNNNLIPSQKNSKVQVDH